MTEVKPYTAERARHVARIFDDRGETIVRDEPSLIATLRRYAEMTEAMETIARLNCIVCTPSSGIHAGCVHRIARRFTEKGE